MCGYKDISCFSLRADRYGDRVIPLAVHSAKLSHLCVGAALPQRTHNIRGYAFVRMCAGCQLCAIDRNAVFVCDKEISVNGVRHAA